MRVLIVDDDAQVRGVARMMLEEMGHEVFEASDGEAGLRAFRGAGADLVLSDLYMPVKDGLEFIRELRRDCPGVRVVAMSGGYSGRPGQFDMLTVARWLGASAILYKPFTPDQALAAIGGA